MEIRIKIPDLPTVAKKSKKKIQLEKKQDDSYQVWIGNEMAKLAEAEQIFDERMIAEVIWEFKKAKIPFLCLECDAKGIPVEREFRIEDPSNPFLEHIWELKESNHLNSKEGQELIKKYRMELAEKHGQILKNSEKRSSNLEIERELEMVEVALEQGNFHFFRIAFDAQLRSKAQLLIAEILKRQKNEETLLKAEVSEQFVEIHENKLREFQDISKEKRKQEVKDFGTLKRIRSTYILKMVLSMGRFEEVRADLFEVGIQFTAKKKLNNSNEIELCYSLEQKIQMEEILEMKDACLVGDSTFFLNVERAEMENLSFLSTQDLNDVAFLLFQKQIPFATTKDTDGNPVLLLLLEDAFNFKEAIKEYKEEMLQKEKKKIASVGLLPFKKTKPDSKREEEKNEIVQIEKKEKSGSRRTRKTSGKKYG